MKKAKRIILRVLIGVLALFALLWIFVWAYVTYNKSGLIEKVKAGINKKIKDRVDIKDISIDFFRNFPNISVRLSGVTIHDSLYEQHHHEFLNAGTVYAKLRFFSVFSGKPDLDKIIIEDAKVYYYNDSTGYTNRVRIRTADNDPSARKGGNVPDILVKNSRLIFDYPAHRKYHDIELKEMEWKTSNTDSGRIFKININSFVHGLAFNDSLGSYIKGKTLKGQIKLLMVDKKELSLVNARLDIDDHAYDVAGNFFLGPGSHFDLHIKTKNIPFKKAVAVLTEQSQKNFAAYDISKPIDINADLDGSLAYRQIPLAKVTFTVKNADLETAAGKFNKCSFDGFYTNEIISSKPRLNDNSMIQLKNFSCTWQNIPLDSKMLEITNLTTPFIRCDVHSAFDLATLNELTGSNSLMLNKGNGEMQMHYEGSLVSNDSAGIRLDGTISLKNAEATYLPRNMTFRNLAADLEFKEKDLFIRQMHTSAGTTILNMNGSVKNFAGLIYSDPDKLTLNWNVSTPSVDIVDFLGFLGKKNAVVKKSTIHSRVLNVSNKIDRMLQNGTAQLNVQATRVKYKNFNASNVNTSLALLNDKVVLNNARLDHAGGTITMSGSLLDEGVTNQVSLRSNIANVDIPAMLRAFDNFGQDAVTWQNMKGRLTASVNMTTALNDKGGVRPNSMNSTVDFSVKDAELNDFEPFQKISVSVFKKRDFSHVRFAELKNRFEIKGSAINIGKMEIRSNVFTMFVDGVYDTRNGTDMNILLPLSNLKKSDEDEVLINKGKVGMHIRLRAKTGSDGKLNVSWNPLGIKGLFKKKSLR